MQIDPNVTSELFGWAQLGSMGLLLFFVLQWVGAFFNKWAGKFWAVQDRQATAVVGLAAQIDKSLGAQEETLIVMRVVARQNDEQSERLRLIEAAINQIKRGHDERLRATS